MNPLQLPLLPPLPPPSSSLPAPPLTPLYHNCQPLRLNFSGRRTKTWDSSRWSDGVERWLCIFFFVRSNKFLIDYVYDGYFNFCMDFWWLTRWVGWVFQSIYVFFVKRFHIWMYLLCFERDFCVSFHFRHLYPKKSVSVHYCTFCINVINCICLLI